MCTVLKQAVHFFCFFKFPLIAEVPRTDTANSHPSVQKPERATLFLVLCGNGIDVLQERTLQGFGVLFSNRHPNARLSLQDILCLISNVHRTETGGAFLLFFKFRLIVAASRTDTANSHPLVQKLERAMLFPVFVWEWYRYSARAILARLPHSVQ